MPSASVWGCSATWATSWTGGRDARRLEPVEQRLRLEPRRRRADELVELAAVRDPSGFVRKRGVLDRLGDLECLGKRGEQAVVPGRDHHLPVALPYTRYGAMEGKAVPCRPGRRRCRDTR